MADPLRGRGARVLPVVAFALIVLLAPPPSVGAQAATATVRVQENFRAEPNGEVMGVLEPGAPLRILSRRDRWLEAEAEGWVWMRSLQVARRDGLDLIVSQEGGENLRAEPSGRVLGRLERGTLLDERERIPGWIRVRRRGWLWAASADVADGPAAPTAAPAEREAAPTPARPGPGETDPPTPSRRADATPAAGGPTGRSALGDRFQRPGAAGAAILSSPDGDTLAMARAGRELTVLAREGSWARVRVDGWVWMPPAGNVTEPGVEGDPVLGEATPSDVVARPDVHRGRLVSWELQFISHEQAEQVRTDFYEGEPFLLARHEDGLFVYVAVPPDRLGEVEGLIALERIAIVGRVRVGASDLTGSPILDLVELRRVSRR